MDIRKVASLAIPGLPSLTGLAGIIFGVLIITDCVRFQEKPGQCDNQFKNGAIAVGLGISGVVGSVGSYITKNPWIRDSAEDLISDLIVRIDKLNDEKPAPAEPEIIPVFRVEQLVFSGMTKEEIINTVQANFNIALSSKLSKAELIEAANSIQNLANRNLSA